MSTIEDRLDQLQHRLAWPRVDADPHRLAIEEWRGRFQRAFPDFDADWAEANVRHAISRDRRRPLTLEQAFARQWNRAEEAVRFKAHGTGCV